MTTDQTTIPRRRLGYTYEFALDELDAVSDCLDAHGFAIIKEVLDDGLVRRTQQAVWDGTDPARTLKAGKDRTDSSWPPIGDRSIGMAKRKRHTTASISPASYRYSPARGT